MANKRFILDQTQIKKLLTVFKLKIPDFQRNFVWKKEKKEALLESLFRGFPIGALTLYEDEQSYYIIDGLQRINTLNQYLSRPNEVIRFKKYYEKIQEEIEAFLQRKGLEASQKPLRRCIEKWYRGLNGLYEYEKISVLYNALKSETLELAAAFADLQPVEELLGILKSRIEIVNDDIALIIYRGDKNDLPDLFKNINTGSVALSQYEILQSVWNDYLLDKQGLEETYEAYNKELQLINADYEVNVAREQGSFDIFKNLLGLNHLICSQEQANIIFKETTLKTLPVPREFADGTKKYYENDGIAFELYSTVLCGAPNKIVKGIDLVYSEHQKEEINTFVGRLNRIICEAVATVIREVYRSGYELMDSKYHSLYVLAGIIFARYDIDAEALSIRETPLSSAVFHESLNLKMHMENQWFTGDNRQVSFFNIKIRELLDLKKETSDYLSVEKDDSQEGVLKLMVNGRLVEAYTVREFYRRLFNYLLEHNLSFESQVPFATGRKRYLINTTARHITNTPFVSPLKIGKYYIETNKSKSGAVRDVYRFLEAAGVAVEYV